MNQSSDSSRESRLPFVIAYVILAGIGAIAINALQESGESWQAAAGLLLLFGILMARMPSSEAPMVWRHLYLIAQTCVTGAMMFQFQPGLFVALFFVLSAQAMTTLPRRPGLLWIGAFSLVNTAIHVHQMGWSEGLLMAPIQIAGFLFFGIFAQLLARSDAARAESQALLGELEEAHRRLQDFATRVEELAAVEERNRLAREMHDTLGHRLTVAAVQLEGAQRLIEKEPERAVGMVGTVREQVREALSELRSTVAALRAPPEADLQLRNSLERMAVRFEEATGIVVHRVLPDEIPSLPDLQRMALYRAAQEALTNVQRHAQARQVWLTLMAQPERIVLLVRDDGMGYPAGPIQDTSFGLRGLRERASQLGGEVTLETRSGGGAQLRLSIPLPVPEDEGTAGE